LAPQSPSSTFVIENENSLNPLDNQYLGIPAQAAAQVSQTIH